MRQLIRGLDFTGATALVAGSMIGTGVFFKAAIMSQQVGSPALVLAAWLAAGLMSLAGALTYAELGAMFPKAGGEYNFLRAAYGPMPGSWTAGCEPWSPRRAWPRWAPDSRRFSPPSCRLHAVWASTTLHLFGREIAWQLGVKELVAVAMILLFGVANCAGVAFGGRLQTVLTGAKVLGIAIIIAGAYFFSNDGTFSNVTSFMFSPLSDISAARDVRGGGPLRAVGLRWMGVHADGGGRNEKPGAQRAAGADGGRARAYWLLWLGEPRLFLRAAVRSGGGGEFDPVSRRAAGGVEGCGARCRMFRGLIA